MLCLKRVSASHGEEGGGGRRRSGCARLGLIVSSLFASRFLFLLCFVLGVGQHLYLTWYMYCRTLGHNSRANQDVARWSVLAWFSPNIFVVVAVVVVVFCFGSWATSIPDLVYVLSYPRALIVELIKM